MLTLRRPVPLCALGGLLAACAEPPAPPSVDATAACPGPDAYDIALTSDRDGNFEIYTLQGDGSGVRRLTDDPASDFAPRWSSDGRSLVFNSDRDGDFDLYVIGADGTGLRRLLDTPVDEWDPVWAHDGGAVVYGTRAAGNSDIERLDLATGERRMLVAHAADDYNPALSPDGARLAFLSNRDVPDRGMDNEVYVLDLASGAITRVTHDDRRQSILTWTADGARLVFTTHPWAVAPDTAATDDEIWSVRADGSDARNLTAHPASDEHAYASPDGCWILFDSTREGGAPGPFLMRPDGSDVTRIPSDPAVMDLWGSLRRRGGA